jgi:hypothetical protein
MKTPAERVAQAIACGLSEKLSEEGLPIKMRIDIIRALRTELLRAGLGMTFRAIENHDTIPCPPPEERH